MKKISLALSFAFFFLSLEAQIIESTWGNWSSHQQVKAENGLRLRAAPNLYSETVALLPNHALITTLHEDDPKWSTIEGIKGYWAKVYWKGKTGYVFSGYVTGADSGEPFAAINPSVDFINEWSKTGFARGKTHVGLFKGNRSFEFELRNLDFEDIPGEEYLKARTEDEIPLWYFTNMYIARDKKIRGRIVDRMLYIGEIIRTNSGIIYADGNFTQTKTEKGETHMKIDPYQLKVRKMIKGKEVEQLLVQMTFSNGNNYGSFEGPAAVIHFIGDLDGDEKDDILLRYQSSYKGWDYAFFSSEHAQEGDIFATFHVGYGSE